MWAFNYPPLIIRRIQPGSNLVWFPMLSGCLNVSSLYLSSNGSFLMSKPTPTCERTNTNQANCNNLTDFYYLGDCGF